MMELTDKYFDERVKSRYEAIKRGYDKIIESARNVDYTRENYYETFMLMNSFAYNDYTTRVLAHFRFNYNFGVSIKKIFEEIKDC